MTRTLRVASIQMRGDRAPLEQKLSRIDVRLREAAGQGARLAVLPELALSGYELGDWNFAAAQRVPDGHAVAALVELARFHDLVVVAGLSEREGDHVYNTMAVVGPDGFLGKYRKIHVASAECAYWRPGAPGQAAIETDLGRIGVGICADMTQPTPWADYAKQGVDLVAIGASWPDYRDATNYPLWREYRESHVEGLRHMPERIERLVGAPVIMANACGDTEVMVTRFGPTVRSRMGGRSRIVCGGTRIDDGADNQEHVLVAAVEIRPRILEHREEQPLPWVQHGSPAFKTTFQWVDRVTGAFYRPLYFTSRSRSKTE